MRYCKKCLMPDTKPYISFDKNGVCNACQAHEEKDHALGGINWDAREKEFEKIILEVKEKKAPFYDVLVPVSGGKDSLTQVHRLLKYDIRILAVNVDYGIKTDVGNYNLSLVPKMGANLMIYRPELNLHRRLIRIGFEDFGDPDLLSHTLLHAYPLHIALRFQIPLVLHGENSAFEYGGDESLAHKKAMTREWFSKYAANKGHDARYISKHYSIPMEKLYFYDFPDELENSDTRSIFMSYYFFWDSEDHLKLAQLHGFKSLEKPSEGTFRNYVGIDEKINRLHQYIKVLKFGYGRATDHACEDIRNGRISRQEAKELVREFDLQDISDYYVNDFLDFIAISREEFYAILEKYRNKNIWKRDDTGKWYIPEHLQDGPV